VSANNFQAGHEQTDPKKQVKTMRKYFLMVFLMLPCVAHAWWNDKWPTRLPVTVDTSATGAGISENAGDVAVLVKLHTGNFQDFFSLKEDLSDLRFIGEDDKTPLKFHVEHFDLVNQLLYVWVRVPQIAGGINTGRFWMYYGNAEAVAAQDSGGSYDEFARLVYHFKAGDKLPQDSSMNANNAVAATATLATSAIASGLKFDSGNTVTINDSPSLTVSAAQGATIGFWLKPGSLQGDAWLLQRSGNGSELVLGLEQNNLYARLKLPNGRVAETNKSPSVRADVWQYITLVIAPTKLTVFVDGKEVATTALQLQDFGGSILVGNGAQGNHPFVGELDELRIDTTVRGNGWIALQVANQGMQDKLLQIQQSEQLGAGGGHGSNFWNVIIGSQDEAGWTMIISLGIMGVITWFVMIGKGLYVGRVQKENASFLEQYRALGDSDPVLLDRDDTEEDKALENSPIAQALFGNHDHFQSSPIYRVYHRGVQEAHSRLGKSLGAGASGLAPQSITAIRATLDTQVVLEMQRLNGQMVLLTIAIAGGPFIGLLGTVVGVMITFAAIAASGDVNIAAIAPGVAAALAATVAGLLVAIPALFGYNYLMSRIKATTADMRVFADEFIARLAEYYSK
jgi:biopolymer transport protein ExbB